MENFELQFPWALALLVPLAACLARQLLKREPALRIPSLARFREAGTPTRRLSPARLVPALFYAAAGALLIIALAGPRFSAGEIRRRAEGTDVMLAVDLSDSMAAFDPAKTLRTDEEIAAAHRRGETKRRLDVCKEELEKFIRARPNDRIGLIAFADLAFAVCPPTLDHAWLLKRVAALELHTVGEGTGLAAPIVSVVNRTKDSDAKRKVMVLFTDGANTAQNKVSPEQAARIAKDYGLTVHTVGIGGERAYVVQNGFLGARIVHYPNAFDEAALKKIAEITGGNYYAADDRDAMRAALAEIDKLEKKSEELPRVALYDERADAFAGLALACLLIGFALSRAAFPRFP